MVTRKRSSVSSQKKQKRGVSYFLKKYVLGVITAFAVFGFMGFFFLSHHQQPLCANSKTCQTDLSLHIDNNVLGTFAGKTVYPPKVNGSPQLTDASVLGISTGSGEKHIFVDLSTQTLTAYQGTTKVFQTLVSTGKWNRTPTGNFHIWEKLVSTRMAGGEGADAYDLPNVPYVMYFYNDFGLHGAYWHDNFGHTMSHGCVNLRQVDAKTLYDWADGPSGNTPGTAVSVCDSITNDNQCIQNNPVQ